jgi:hypothetical protein
MDLLLHTQCAIRYNPLQTFCKEIFKIHSVECCGRVGRLAGRQAIHNSGYLWTEQNKRHANIWLTSYSDFISGDVISKGSCSSWVSEASSTFISVIWFPPWEYAGHVWPLGSGSIFRKLVQLYKTIISLSITLHEIKHSYIETILQFIKLITTVVCRISLQLTKSYLKSNFMEQRPTWMLRDTQLVKKYLAFHWTRRFITRIWNIEHYCGKHRTWNLRCVRIFLHQCEMCLHCLHVRRYQFQRLFFSWVNKVFLLKHKYEQNLQLSN